LDESLQEVMKNTLTKSGAFIGLIKFIGKLRSSILLFTFSVSLCLRV